jgi:hypothetical protein
LGVCDVWRLELSALQWPWLLDELEEVRGPLEEALQRASADHASAGAPELVDKVDALELELQAVRGMRAQLPALGEDRAIVLVGPAELIRDLVQDTLSNVVHALSDAVNAPRPRDRAARRAAITTARAAFEWTATVAGCAELEWFSMDARDDGQRTSAGGSG